MSELDGKPISQAERDAWRQCRMMEWEMERARGMQGGGDPVPRTQEEGLKRPGVYMRDQFGWTEPEPKPVTAWSQFLELIGWGKR